MNWSIIFDRSAHCFGLGFISVLFGLGLTVVMAASLAGFHPVENAELWGSFLTHFAEADTDKRWMALAPFLFIWSVGAVSCACGLTFTTRRKGARLSNG